MQLAAALPFFLPLFTAARMLLLACTLAGRPRSYPYESTISLYSASANACTASGSGGYANCAALSSELISASARAAAFLRRAGFVPASVEQGSHSTNECSGSPKKVAHEPRLQRRSLQVAHSTSWVASVYCCEHTPHALRSCGSRGLSAKKDFDTSVAHTLQYGAPANIIEQAAGGGHSNS